MLKGARGQRREGQRAHRAFGHLPVAGEPVIGASGGQRQGSTVPHDFDGGADRVMEIPVRQGVGFDRCDTFAGAAECFENSQVGGAKAFAREVVGKLADGIAVPQQNDEFLSHSQHRPQPGKRRGMQPETGGRLQRPAHARGGQRKGGDAGKGAPFAGGEAFGQRRARAEPERIT